MKTQFLLIPVLAFATVTAWAGVETHGGGSIVCRNAKGRIFWAELLDTFEAREVHKLDDLRQTQHGDPREILQARLARVKSWSPQFGERIQKEIDSMIGQQHFLKRGDPKLPLTADLYPELPPALKHRNCQYEQVAVYSQDSLTVDPEIFAKLSSVDQGALWLHEALYKMAREFNPDLKTSVAVRGLVGVLLQANSFYSLQVQAQAFEAFFNNYDPARPLDRPLWFYPAVNGGPEFFAEMACPGDYETSAQITLRVRPASDETKEKRFQAVINCKKGDSTAKLRPLDQLYSWNADLMKAVQVGLGIPSMPTLVDVEIQALTGTIKNLRFGLQGLVAQKSAGQVNRWPRWEEGLIENSDYRLDVIPADGLKATYRIYH